MGQAAAKDKAGGSETSARKVPGTMEIVINGQLIKARILATGKSYMNTQLVQILRKERYANGVTVTSTPFDVEEIGFVVEGLSAQILSQVKNLQHLVKEDDALCLKPVEIFFSLYELSPPGRAPWRVYAKEPLAGLSLYDVSMANLVSENILAKGVKSYPNTTNQGARYAMAASVAPASRMDVQVMNDIQLKTQLVTRVYYQPLSGPKWPWTNGMGIMEI